VDGLPVSLWTVKAKKIRKQVLIASIYKGTVVTMTVGACFKEKHKARAGG
jgi:hypothetical protein